ncbi:class II aldolase/adducin family protein [Alloalcanivorax xenomutans]|jgi:ribulose-5-phosphate 4-epimerase/fuculose-1-phosphate aldolase|uniref:Class II aldolase/adducin family protein n=1 Tax=Alloalcanivorax xenomutans TaxID=1094342 RepID=A0A9Q3W3D8_9GAMM|nr:class II aldolase/adducin family protein [Alloalcanivorax xenomutans]KYZ86003.1 class II aldolase [Alcanivorax sp. KX64203]MBA4721635.1 class II aldolase/adducin family protein [Alcanivorax sp.]MCE7507622.1 class II aldolase/adducin family protein [Alloalcanivorax xenomutans]MCE7524688.1 class II aldolase/adducin family protein [Alloalcanivorax xenomutans]PHS72110.1 MAG: class II aldolase [Alcanivorax sp.]|tara:strand:+ start:119 stop:877 length:759 start_codon:yes stop_codon:yes gene_type:complete
MSQATATARPQMTEAEWEVRKDLAAAYRLVALYGWEDLVFTHLSARVPGPEHHFLINPYGMLFDEITASSLVKVDQDGEIVDPGATNRVNPAGFTIHSAVHMAREEAGAVLHLHAADGVAVSAHKNGLLPLSQTAMLCLDHLSYHDFEGVALNLDERERLVKDLGDKNLMLLRNHGTLSVGKDVGEAFTYMYFLMKGCEIQVRAMAQGETYQPSAEAIATTSDQSKSLGMASKLTWPALLRKLERAGSDYAR